MLLLGWSERTRFDTRTWFPFGSNTTAKTSLVGGGISVSWSADSLSLASSQSGMPSVEPAFRSSSWYASGGGGVIHFGSSGRLNCRFSRPLYSMSSRALYQVRWFGGTIDARNSRNRSATARGGAQWNIRPARSRTSAFVSK